jgi:hypothetical protein
MHPVVRAILQAGFIKGKAYFGGSGAYLSFGGQADFAFGTGDFCIETIYSPSVNGTIHEIICFGNAGASIAPRIYRYSDNTLYYHVNGTRIHGAATLLAGNSYHIAISRSSGVTRLFVNGVQDGADYTDANNYVVSAGRPFIGVSPILDGYLVGYMFGVRATKGRARYTSNFTPPTSFSVDGADVPLCMSFAEPIGSTTFIDDTGKTVTTVGNVVIVE